MRLDTQASRQQWAANGALNFSQPIEMSAEYREIWRELATAFYRFEKMGLHALSRKQVKAANKYPNDATLESLTRQSADEGLGVTRDFCAFPACRTSKLSSRN